MHHAAAQVACDVVQEEQHRDHGPIEVALSPRASAIEASGEGRTILDSLVWRLAGNRSRRHRSRGDRKPGRKADENSTCLSDPVRSEPGAHKSI